MSWNWLVIIAGMALLVTRSTLAPAVVLASLIPHLFFVRRVWNSAGDTAMRPALVWTALALVLGIATEAAAPWETLASGRPIAGHLAYFSVLATLAALVSVLNARTPGAGAWAWLTAMLVVVFLIPWLEGPGLGRAGNGLARLRLQNPWNLFFGLLVFAGVTNYLPTRYGLAALCLGLGLTSFALALSGGVSVERRALLWTAFPGALSLAAQCAQWNAARVRRVGARCDALWLWFRDHWGVVWALRVQDRFNRSAAAQEWPFRLSWEGLVNSDGPVAAPPDAEALLAQLLRRFATPARLRRATESGVFSSCQPADGLR